MFLRCDSSVRVPTPRQVGEGQGRSGVSMVAVGGRGSGDGRPTRAALTVQGGLVLTREGRAGCLALGISAYPCGCNLERRLQREIEVGRWWNRYGKRHCWGAERGQRTGEEMETVLPAGRAGLRLSLRRGDHRGSAWEGARRCRGPPAELEYQTKQKNCVLVLTFFFLLTKTTKKGLWYLVHHL